MNNNICKWGKSHRQTLLQKVNKISRHLASKLIFSLFLVSHLVCAAGIEPVFASHFSENTPYSTNLEDGAAMAAAAISDEELAAFRASYVHLLENGGAETLGGTVPSAAEQTAIKSLAAPAAGQVSAVTTSGFTSQFPEESEFTNKEIMVDYSDAYTRPYDGDGGEGVFDSYYYRFSASQNAYLYLTYNNYSSIKYTDSAFWANSITFAKGSLLQELVFENVDFRVQNGEDTSLDTSQVSKSNFYAFKITMKDVYVENWVPDGKVLTWTLGNYDLMAGIGAEVEIDGLTFASGTSSYFDLNMTVGDLTLRNVTWDSPGALQVNIFGSLTEEISFTDTMSSEVRFSAVADNNIVDENFTGKLTVGYKVGSFTVWNPDNAADINASEIVVSTNETILYTDTLDQYKGTFTATDQYYLELRHDEDVDRFATHEFSANTTISGAVSPGYSMAEKAYGWGTNSNILKLQAGDDFDIMVIGDGDGTAAGGFSNITYYDDSFDSYQGYEGAYEFFATYA